MVSKEIVPLATTTVLSNYEKHAIDFRSFMGEASHFVVIDDATILDRD
jgi:hypothetical protein